MGECVRRRWVGVGCVVGFGLGFRHGQQLAQVGQVGGATAVGEEPVVADAMEALRQHVHEEAADELVRGERHGLVPAGSLDPVILELEGDALRIGRDQPAVGDRDAVGIAREIGQHRLGSGEGTLGVVGHQERRPGEPGHRVPPAVPRLAQCRRPTARLRQFSLLAAEACWNLYPRRQNAREPALRRSIPAAEKDLPECAGARA